MPNDQGGGHALKTAKEGSRTLFMNSGGEALVYVLGHNALLLTRDSGYGASACLPDRLSIIAPTASQPFGNHRDKRKPSLPSLSLRAEMVAFFSLVGGGGRGAVGGRRGEIAYLEPVGAVFSFFFGYKAWIFHGIAKGFVYQ